MAGADSRYRALPPQHVGRAVVARSRIDACVERGDCLAVKVQVNQEMLREFCRQRGIARLELFGSALREDFREDSDVDLLCSLRPDAQCGLFGWVALKHSEPPGGYVQSCLRS